MSAMARPRNNDHWSVRLQVPRPGTGGRLAVLVLVLVQAVLMILTASSIGTGGGLYGCSGPCGTSAAPTTPALAVLLGIIMLLLPLVIGALSATWQAAIAFAALPWFPALILGANGLLAPTASVVTAPPVAGQRGPSPLVSRFGPPFWLDSAHLPVLLFSLGLFALLGFIGWAVSHSMREA
jgi:hypothetical protein